MITDQNFLKFQCVLSQQRHFLIDPIKLVNCDHSVCKSCLQDGKITKIKCVVCEVISEIDYSKIQISEGLKQELQSSLGSIFKIVEKDTSSKVNEIKGSYQIYW